jgi:ABC-2 type transport system ATP-binding protein
MRILACIFPPTSGSVTVAGLDILKDSGKVREKIGYLPEYTPYYPDMRVEQYLRFVARMKGVPRGQRKSRVRDALSRCGLEEVERRFIKNLSRGFLQRVGLAQALVNSASVLVLDEPTLGLDPKQRVAMRSLIRSASQEGRAVILSTHMLEEASMMCNRILLINRGRIITADTPDNLNRKLQNNLRIRVRLEGQVRQVEPFLRSLPIVKDLVAEEEQPGVVSCIVMTDMCETTPKVLSQAIFEGGWSLLEMKSEDLSLEEMFLEVIRRQEVSEKAAKPSATIPAREGHGDSAPSRKASKGT